MSAVRDDNHRLTKTVSELRADRRAQDRKLKDLQHQLDLAREKVVNETVPMLPIEVASPTGTVATRPTNARDQRVVAVTEDGTEIVYEGDAAAGKQAVIGDEPMAEAPRRASPRERSEPATNPERIEVTRRPATERSARRTKVIGHDVPGERAAAGDPASDYRVAVELVKTGPHADAIAALRTFLAKFPRHDYADNAQYWLGEAYYAQKDYQHSLVEFRTVIETYPRGNKVPDALLKVGYCYAALGQRDKSRAVLEQVVNLYPKTEPAALAAKRLGDSR